MEQRVARLEEDVREIKDELRSIRTVLVEIRERLSTIEGKLDRTPTAMQIWSMIFSTWVAGAGIVLIAFWFFSP